MENKILFIEKASLALDDAAAKKREEIAERLRQGRDVEIQGNSGEMTTPEDMRGMNGPKLKVDKDKLATAFYWYEKDRKRYDMEVKAMRQLFPKFQMEKLDDGRLCWVGKLNPNGKTGGIWTIMAVCDHNHPHNNSWGGSVRVYSIQPDLNELYSEIGQLPNTLRDESGILYICTCPQALVKKVSFSVAAHIGYATRWIKLLEDWTEGIIGDNYW